MGCGPLMGQTDFRFPFKLISPKPVFLFWTSSKLWWGTGGPHWDAAHVCRPEQSSSSDCSLWGRVLLFQHYLHFPNLSHASYMLAQKLRRGQDDILQADTGPLVTL